MNLNPRKLPIRSKVPMIVRAAAAVRQVPKPQSRLKNTSVSMSYIYALTPVGCGCKSCTASAKLICKLQRVIDTAETPT
eukprot:CAMPEP_0115440770 /NCGR_PEP_ID=MMETSP0271-20121206/36470_1 /TAXON_ID=71861 /ORGANISM="Scrippsiella trochoidea, Strain CCMP3099" /LENGTH=78 /DNA_ID=CAMNT_0002866517 /DNA_START=57 /DNA_END=289 /DNA_ORIENTATION=+